MLKTVECSYCGMTVIWSTTLRGDPRLVEGPHPLGFICLDEDGNHIKPHPDLPRYIRHNCREYYAKPKSKPVLLTRGVLNKLKGQGGFTKRQLSILGVAWPPKKGWLKRMVGKSIS